MIDVKNYSEANHRCLEAGVEIIQTKFSLKKDGYAMIINRKFNKMLICNGSERVVLSTQDGLPIFHESLTKVDEQSHCIFSITCSGSSISKNKDLIAVGDFLGNIRIYSAISDNATLIK